MTRARIRPMTRDEKMPMPTWNAERPVLGGFPSAPCPSSSAFGPLRSALIKVFVRRGLAERAARLLHQIGLDEHVDVSIEDAVDIPDLLLRPVILDHPVRVQHVAPNLMAERDFLFRAANLIELRLILLNLDV